MFALRTGRADAIEANLIRACDILCAACKIAVLHACVVFNVLILRTIFTTLINAELISLAVIRCLAWIGFIDDANAIADMLARRTIHAGAELTYLIDAFIIERTTGFICIIGADVSLSVLAYRAGLAMCFFADLSVLAIAAAHAFDGFIFDTEFTIFVLACFAF